MARARSFFALLLGGLLAACTAAVPEDVEATDQALSPDTAIADADSAGRVSVRAGVLTLTFSEAARFETRGSERVLVLRAKSSRNLVDVRSFVPDDVFGEATLVAPREIEIMLRMGHETNTILSGLPLALDVNTQNGSPRDYQAEVFLGAKLVSGTGDSRLRLVPAIRPVHGGPTNDPLRYRARLETTRTPASVAVQDAKVTRVSAQRYDIDWTYDAFAKVFDPPASASTPLSVAAKIGTADVAREARVEIGVTRLGLTTKTIDTAWPKTCNATVKRCVDRATSSLPECGSYREIEICRNAEPPPPTSVSQAEARIRADVLSKTGVTWSPSILQSRREGNRTIALVALGRGGSAEFSITANEVTLDRFVDRASFMDSSLVTRFEGQLRTLHGMPNARIVAHGTPQGGQPLWHFVVDRDGVRSTVALRATSATASTIVPFVFDANAFREIAGHLSVERGLVMAQPAGLYAELEVTLRAMQKLATAAGLEDVAAGESAVGFNPATESQLVFTSIWGDNAVFTTMVRSTGAVRVEDFN